MFPLRPPVLMIALAHALVACAGRPGREPPAASFLVVAGDSTFWVESRGDGSPVRVRRSALLLANVADRFYELYVADDDRSYFDAVVIGQRIFRRDIVTGDSTMLFDDDAIAGVARAYATAHPNAAPLAPDEDGAENPATQATSETELVDVLGPYLTFEQHVDVETVGVREQHATRRGVLDVRDGHSVHLDNLVGSESAGSVYTRGVQQLNAAIDSIRETSDARADLARNAIDAFTFDSLSFALLETDGAPSVAFLVPGHGPRAGGYTLPLPPLPIPAAPWWSAVRSTLPSTTGDVALWGGEDYSVVAREDSLGESAHLALRSARNEWPVARFPAPVRRVLRLDHMPDDTLLLAALARAFDESAISSGEARTAFAGRARAQWASATGPYRVASP